MAGSKGGYSGPDGPGLSEDREYEREARSRGGPTQPPPDYDRNSTARFMTAATAHEGPSLAPEAELARKLAAYRAAEAELYKVLQETDATVGGVGTTPKELIAAMLARGFEITYAGVRL